jgi:hypothetical protein
LRTEFVQLVDRNSVHEYAFVGGCGEKVITNAEKLLALVRRRAGADLASLFATPRFDETQSHVMWFAGEGGIVPFQQLPDAEQRPFLDALERHRDAVCGLAAQVAQEAASPDALVYAQLLPLLLNFPEPLEYHLFQVGGRPVVTNWAMNKNAAQVARDTVTPFVAAWRARLAEKERQARELAENEVRERSFLGRLRMAGARSGAVTVSLIWNDINDLDLHVVCPDGARIGFDNKQACGGLLDVDRNAHGSALTRQPVENIVWSRKPALSGTYTVKIHFFRRHDAAAAESAFSVRLRADGKVRHASGRLCEGEIAEACTFTV